MSNRFVYQGLVIYRAQISSALISLSHAVRNLYPLY